LTQRLAANLKREIYLGRKSDQSAEVVVKLFCARQTRLGESSDDGGWHRECEVLQRVQHPLIAHLEASGSLPDGRRYLATRWIEGETLWQWIERDGGLPQAVALPLLIQIAEAVEQVHNCGFQHGDLAPKNIMVAGQSQIALIDFGLAQQLNEPSTGCAASTMIAGTPAFMSPESCRPDDGKPLTVASDIYSFGCVAYAMLAGRVPLTGATSIEICWKQLHQAAPALSSVASLAIAPALESLVMQCLEKEPQRRPASMSLIRQQLEQLSS